jgi:Fe-S-cluster containining protein
MNLGKKTRKKTAALKKLYALHDAFSAGLDVPCQEKCAHCCVVNVAATSLEGLLVIEYLSENREKINFDPRRFDMGRKRFQPQTTPNQLAALCENGAEAPEEETDPSWGKCPLLKDDICPVYPARPFACRSMSSTEKCRKNGHAVMDPFSVTVSLVFMQCIEHLDADGFSGNLMDILVFMEKNENRRKYDAGDLSLAHTTLIGNRPAKKILVPAEHRGRMAPLFAEITSALS